MSDGINFDDQQDEWERMDPQERDHFTKAVMHKAGLGPHPGVYQGPPRRPPGSEDPTVTELASQHMRELPAADPAQEKPPVPPQEELSGTGGDGGKKKQQTKAPSGGTPAALGAKAVEPPEPSGNF